VHDDRSARVSLPLTCSDLSAGPLGRIPARGVTLEPERLDLPAHGQAEVTVRVHVPRVTRPGLYEGSLQQVGETRVRTTIIVDVRPAHSR
jgi:hypothetical protein